MEQVIDLQQIDMVMVAGNLFEEKTCSTCMFSGFSWIMCSQFKVTEDGDVIRPAFGTCNGWTPKDIKVR